MGWSSLIGTENGRKLWIYSFTEEVALRSNLAAVYKSPSIPKTRVAQLRLTLQQSLIQSFILRNDFGGAEACLRRCARLLAHLRQQCVVGQNL